jgi:general L-amino acid transport system substrate-binding protein
VTKRTLVISLLLAGLLVIGAVPRAHAADGETLAQVKARGLLRCGVSEGIAGFSMRKPRDAWSGIDVEFCRAVAAAALGSPDKVSFVPLRASERFPALAESRIDLLARNTSWTLLRESTLGVQFAGVLFYDSQVFMVRVPGGPQTLAGLRNEAVCVQKGTSSEGHLLAYSAANRLNMHLVALGSAAETRDAFFSGRCSAWTGDASQLAAARIAAPGGPQTCTILPERIAQEPLGPAVRGDDLSWLVLVRWVLIALLGAEELGLTQANLASRSHEAGVRTALVAGEEIDRNLGVEPGWALRAVQAVGNYGEMFDRNLGPASPLNLERGPNRLWTQGGLMYVPPIR